jgi:uncharacterized integral membrane protein
MKSKTILLTIAVVLIFIILLQNMETVFVQLLVWSVSAPLLILLLSALLVGLAIGWFSHFAYARGKYSRKKPADF